MFEEERAEHHRRNRGSGGSRNPAINLPSNLLLVCGTPTTLCHGWIGNHPAEAMDLGFSVSTNGRIAPSAVRVKHAVHGLIYLLDDGGWLPAGEPADRLLADLHETAAAADAPAVAAEETTPNPSEGTES